MNLDETELKMLIELQKEGRQSRRILADKVGVSTPTVSSKLEKLENMGIIEGFRVELDHSKIGFQKYYLQIESEGYTEEGFKKLVESHERFRALEKLEGGPYLLTLFVNHFNQVDEATTLIEEEEGVKILDLWRVQEEEKKIPWLPLDENVPLDINCYYCNKPIEGDPVKWKKDGKEHYLCCSSCKELYEEKYERLQKRKKEMREKE